MAKTATVSVRIDAEVKRQAEEILASVGMPVSVLINTLFRQIIIKGRVPFDITLAKSEEEPA